MTRVKSVAVATTSMIGASKALSAQCPDATIQANIMVAAKAAAMATAQLATVAKVCTQAYSAYAKVLAPTINSPLCQEQIVECARVVADTVESFVVSSQVRAYVASI
jgi:talin